MEKLTKCFTKNELNKNNIQDGVKKEVEQSLYNSKIEENLFLILKKYNNLSFGIKQKSDEFNIKIYNPIQALRNSIYIKFIDKSQNFYVENGILNLGFIKIKLSISNNLTLSILKDENLKIDDIKNFFVLFDEIIIPQIDLQKPMPDKFELKINTPNSDLKIFVFHKHN